MRSARIPRRYTITTWEQERRDREIRKMMSWLVFASLLAVIVALSVNLITTKHQLRKERGEIVLGN